MAKRLKKRGGGKESYGSIDVDFPESDVYACPNDYIESNGTATASGFKTLEIVWGKVVEGSAASNTHYHPWWDGNPPDAVDEEPSGSSWCLGPMTVTAGVNTLIVWAAFQGEEGISKTMVVFEVDEEGNEIPEDLCGESDARCLSELEDRIVALERIVMKKKR